VPHKLIVAGCDMAQAVAGYGLGLARQVGGGDLLASRDAHGQNGNLSVCVENPQGHGRQQQYRDDDSGNRGERNAPGRFAAPGGGQST
jgi:hypothetical protein